MASTVDALAAHDDVDPEIRQFVIALNHGYGQFSDFDALPLPERRAAAEAVRHQWRLGGPEMADTRELTIAGCRVRFYRPVASDEPLPALLYVHGGGWTMFSIDTHDRLMREYAGRTGVTVVGVDYSLSPEAKFPVALDEVLAVLRWLREHGRDHGIDPDRIAIGGDSAGANLSVSASLRLRAAGEPLPAAMLLNYGAFDPREVPTYVQYDGPAYMLTVEEMNRFWADYTMGSDSLADPFVAPLRADLTGLTPAFLAIAECDILADTNRVMADRLSAAGVAVETRVYQGATHSFLEAVSISALADRAFAEASDWLSAQLGVTGA